MIGPAIAGVLIATVGVEPCFALNAASFAVMIWVLARDGHRAAAARRGGRARAGRGARRRFATSAATPELWIPLALMASWEPSATTSRSVLPLLARFTFHGGASTYAVLVAAMGLGAIVGALINGARGRVTPMLLIGAALASGSSRCWRPAAPTLRARDRSARPAGRGHGHASPASINSSLQLASEPACAAG